VALNCPPHTPGHSAGFQEDPGKDFAPGEGAEGLDFVGAFNSAEPTGVVRRGSVVTLFSAPGRITIEDAVAAEQLSYTTSVPVVRIGGLPARVLFSGLAPGQTDTWEIRAVVPKEVKPGRLPVTITYEGEKMNSVGVVVE
jgi:uncharacterized protein (TIGR03437 family)